MSITSKVTWDGQRRHWVVEIADGAKSITMPLDQFVELTAVKYVVDDAVSAAASDRG